METLTCPRCGATFETTDGKLPTHDFPKPCRRVCPGSWPADEQQVPAEANSNIDPAVLGVPFIQMNAPTQVINGREYAAVSRRTGTISKMAELLNEHVACGRVIYIYTFGTVKGDRAYWMRGCFVPRDNQ